ncbi:MAG: type II toxin-antitoxin system prevent-host-death family antitoxin [Alphaproteobacteria bacterium]|nr:type II toxin-antitoxin system prevent-host-death family antitoxin [Alphaproteobacteria bacterium]MBL7097877.1 type II toxin-antitoxin system prevent-host-death family antitoxin [Alphaproteobacteria bacterium]
MVRATARQFQRRVGEIQHMARKEPVEITRHGRREFVLMSAEEYDWMRAVMKRSFRTEESPEFIVEAVRKAKMHPRHNHLNKLLK